MKANPALLGFNRGEVSALALMRTDLQAMQLSADTQINWMPRSLGSMSLRPGLGYIGSTRNNAYSRFLPFIFTASDTALIELSSQGYLIPWEDEAVLQRVSNSTAITNGDFDSNVTSWTDADDLACTSEWKTGGYLSLISNGYNKASRYQSVSVSGADDEKVHGIRVVVQQGPVDFAIGSTSSGDEILETTSLATGTHSLAFTPNNTTIYIRFTTSKRYPVLVDSVAIEGSGDVEIGTEWNTNALVDSVRYTASGAVIFVASDGTSQKRIERRGAGSWSLVEYETSDGPFDFINTSAITLSPDVISGDCTITASDNYFRAGHVGSLIRISSTGQEVTRELAGEGQSSGSIRSTGIKDDNSFSFTLSGTWTATISLEYSIDEEETWVEQQTRTANGTINIDPAAEFDNIIAYWRLTVKPGTYSSGVVEVSLSHDRGGSISGVGRITSITSPTSAEAIILQDFGSSNSTLDWYPGIWSGVNGYPTATALFESRLFWAGRGKLYGSATDLFASFTDENPDEFDAPIDRNIGEGTTEEIRWMATLNRLVIGSDVAEITAKSSSFDEPMTLANLNLKAGSTEGSADVQAIKVDDMGVFVGKCGTRLFTLNFNGESNNYIADNIAPLNPDLSGQLINRLAIQRQPDKRIHAIQDDGVVRVIVLDKTEDVIAPIRVQVGGTNVVVEDVVVLPGTIEDNTYYVVSRTVDGGTVRYLEKFALESECIGGDITKLADSFVVYDGSTTSTATAAHLANQSVIVWADGKDLGTFTADGGGTVALGESVSKYVIGLPYTADYKSRKLVEGVAPGQSHLNQLKRVNYLGLSLYKTHYQGVEYGPTFDNLSPLNLVVNGVPTAADTVWEELEEEQMSFSGDSITDPRICLRATAPRPATILGLSIGYKLNHKN